MFLIFSNWWSFSHTPRFQKENWSSTISFRTFSGREAAIVCSVVGKRISAKVVGLIVTSIGSLGKRGGMSWKHLCGGQVIPPLQLNRTFEQLSERVISYGLGVPVSALLMNNYPLITVLLAASTCCIYLLHLLVLFVPFSVWEE